MAFTVILRDDGGVPSGDKSDAGPLDLCAHLVGNSSVFVFRL